MLNWTEFIAALSALEKGSVAARTSFMFRVYDLNGDNSISRAELVRFLISSLHINTVDKHVREMAEYFVDEIFSDFQANEDRSLTVDLALRRIENDPFVRDLHDLLGRSMTTEHAKKFSHKVSLHSMPLIASAKRAERHQLENVRKGDEAVLRRAQIMAAQEAMDRKEIINAQQKLLESARQGLPAGRRRGRKHVTAVEKLIEESQISGERLDTKTLMRGMTTTIAKATQARVQPPAAKRMGRRGSMMERVHYIEEQKSSFEQARENVASSVLSTTAAPSPRARRGSLYAATQARQNGVKKKSKASKLRRQSIVATIMGLGV